MSMTVSTESVLSDQLLTRCRERAPGYDKENRFFQEDFDELKAAGYLRMAIPREFGGPGLNLAEVGRETRKLAMYAPATALALNMQSRSSGFSRKLQPEKCSRPGTPSMATTSPACSRRPRQRE
ncbi:MAG: hypothetical protein DMF88_11595 [Acidobacteria bacterium]|nr:MAG: hypothetical protein DMF88_11595 [Acidobacteriota bacterium]